MPIMLVTLETFQEPIGWLKLLARLNMRRMSVTLETSQEPMAPLKREAPRNMASMSLTLDKLGVSLAA
jgi:hypothetical protein